MPRKQPRRRTSHPGIYDRGTYWQVRIRFTDAVGKAQELENYRAPYDPDASPNSPEHKKRALERAVAYAAAEKKSLHQHGSPRIEVAEQNTLRDWLLRFEREVLDPNKEEDDAAESNGSSRAKKVAAKKVYLRKGWKEEKSVIDTLLNRHANFCSRRITDLEPSDFHGRDDSLSEQQVSRTGEPAAVATVRRRLAVISAVYQHARSSWGFSKIRNPVRDLGKRPKIYNERDRTIDPDEFAKVLAAMSEADATTLAAIQFIRWTACRRSEAVRLRWENIKDWNTREPIATFMDTKTPKPGERLHRSIMLPHGAVAAIKRMIGRGDPPSSGWVFRAPKNKDKHIRADNVTQAWARGRERAGLVAKEGADKDTPRIHDLRHTRTTEIAQHLEAIKVMKITGHRDTRSLARYFHPDERELGRAVARGEAKAKKTSKKSAAHSFGDLMDAAEHDPALRRQIIDRLLTSKN